MEYRVTWVIEVEAESPREAAEEAQRIQRDPDSLATVFVVSEYNNGGEIQKTQSVDLGID